MNEMRGHVGLDHPLAQQFKGHVVATETVSSPRWVTELDGTSIYGEIEPYVFSGDCRFKVTVNKSDGAKWGTLIGFDEARFTTIKSSDSNHPNGLSFGKLAAPGINAPNTVDLGNTQVLGFERIGSTIRLSADEVVVAEATSTTFLGDLTMNRVGRDESGIGSHDYFKGHVLKAEAFDLTLPKDDRLVRDYRFDRTDGVLRNYAPLGALGEKQSLSGGAWTPLGADIYERTTTGSWNHLAASNMQTGERYYVDVEILETYSGSLRLYVRNADNTSNTATVITGSNWHGLVEILWSRSDRGIWLDSSDWSGKVRFVVRRAEGWGVLHGLTSGSIERYQLADNADLIDQLWPNRVRYSGDLTQWGRGAGISVDEAVIRENSPVPLHRIEVLADTSCQLFITCPELTIGKTYTLSIYIEKDSWAGNFQAAYYHGSTLLNAQYHTLSSGVRRYSYTFEVEDAASYAQIRLVGWNTSAPVGSVCYAGGVQLEEGSEATNYKATSAVAGNMIPASPLYKLHQRINHLRETSQGHIRPITRFDGEDMFGEFPEWTANNYRIRIVHRRRSGGMTVNERLLASSGADSIFLNTSGRLAAKLTVASDGSASYATSSVDHTGDELIESTVIKLGNKVLTGLNGEILDAYDRQGLAPIVLSMVSNSSFYEGEFMLFSLEDLDNPLGNSRLYLMDSDSGILYDFLAEKGPDELLYTVGDSWRDNGDGTFTSLDTWGSWLKLGGREGVDYEVDVTVHVHANPQVSNGVHNPLKLGRQKVIVPAGGFPPRIGSGIGSIVEVHAMCEVVNAGQIQNASPDAYPVFIYQGKHKKEWLSPEQSPYTSTQQQEVDSASGEWEYYNLVPVTVGAQYRVTATIHNTVPGKAAGFSSASGIIPSAPFRAYSDTTVGGEYIATNTGPVRLFKHDGSDVYLDNISIREFLKEAH